MKKTIEIGFGKKVERVEIVPGTPLSKILADKTLRKKMGFTTQMLKENALFCTDRKIDANYIIKGTERIIEVLTKSVRMWDEKKKKGKKK